MLKQVIALLNKGNVQDAKALCETVLKNQPQHADAIRLRAIIAKKRG